MSDSLRHLREQQQAMRRMTDALGDLYRHQDPLDDIYRKLGFGAGTMAFLRQEEEHRKILAGFSDGGALAQFAKSMETQRKLMEGPVEEARRLGLFDPQSDIRQSIDAAMTARAEYDRLFRLPELSEIGRIARDATASSAFARALLGTGDALQHAMEGMHSPWLRIDGGRTSAAAFADIMAIGRGLERRPAFDADFASSLRPSLGDWRDVLAIEAQPLVDPLLRTGYYVERGVDTALTDFTPAAFDEGLKVAGLRDTGPEAADDDEETGFTRARDAFDQLQRFEVAIRRFIERVMQAAFGDNWMKHRLPPKMLDDWIDKRERAVKAGEIERPLIDYADFTDYRAIIERRDNWNAVFKPVFGRPEDIRESFQRLFPVRIATMHARLVTRDDELLLSVETRRVLKAIARQ